MNTFSSLFFASFALLTTNIFIADQIIGIPTVVELRTFKDVKHEQEVTRAKGFVWEEDGFILSVYQKLLDPKTQQLLNDIEVFVPEHETWYRADLVGVEPTLNLSILKITPKQPLTVSRVTEYEQLAVGTQVFSPLANGEFAKGILKTLSKRECYQKNMTSTMNITDMILNEDSIGSPIVTQAGEVVGIYTGYQPPGAQLGGYSANVTHLLPAYLASYIFDSLKYKKSMISPWTGFSVRRLTSQEMRAFPTERGEQGGIAIEEVWKNSPAEKLGIRQDDVLLRLGHYKIESPADFQKWLYMYGVGHEVKLLLLRNREYIELNYNIEARPDWAVPD